MKKPVLLLFAFILTIFCNAQGVDLLLKLKKGETYNQLMSSKASIIQTIDGKQQNMEVTITGKMSFFVKSISSQFYDMEGQYKSVSMEISLPQGSKKFSSEVNDTLDVLSTIFSGIKNQTFYIKMTRKGKIEQIKGIDSLVENMIAKLPRLSEEKKLQIRNQVMKAYGEKAFKGYFETAMAIFPDKPVTKGNTWMINTELQSGMEGNMKTTYEFQGESNSNYLIHGNADLETANKDAYIQSNGMPLKYDLTGTMVSDIKIDKESGWIAESEITQAITGTCQIKDNPKMPGGMIIPMTMNNKMTTTDK